jgi:argininosuccinate synthase
MNSDEDNSRCGWFLKDNKDRFINKNCIKKIDSNTYYICYLTFSPEVRAYIIKKTAEEALLSLNEMIEKMNLGICFHIENLSINDAIRQNREFKGNNILIQKVS